MTSIYSIRSKVHNKTTKQQKTTEPVTSADVEYRSAIFIMVYGPAAELFVVPEAKTTISIYYGRVTYVLE